jgi:two-component system chemotaxis sensor kinase CheA
MAPLDDSIIQEFLVESHEGLTQVESSLVALERTPEDAKRIASVFRAIHTIKGTCGFFGFSRLGAVSHAGENLLSRLRAGEVRFTPEIAGALLSLVDAIRRILHEIERTGSEGTGDDSEIIAELTRLQDEAGWTGGGTAATDVPQEAPAPAAGTPAAGTPAGTPAETLRPVAAAEAPRSRPPAEAPPPPPPDPDPVPGPDPDPEAADLATPVADTNIRVDVHLLDRLMNLVGELVLARNQMLQHVGTEDLDSLSATTQRLNLVTTELQEGIMRTRMQQVANLCHKLPRLVRDVAAACGKQVRLEMEGIETELDRTIIEAIRDPLTHLVRNAVDHGIEDPATRRARGKPAEGTLVVRARHEGGKVILEVSDDGAGLSVERIREKARQAGLVAPEREPRMTERDWMNLVFVAGFSTADEVTNVSGRGVGMDVVRNNVERVGGTIDLDSTPDQGTTVRIRIPLTLAIIPALVVAVGRERYAIPQVNLIELLRADGPDALGAVSRVYDAPVYRYRSTLLPLVLLHDVLGVGADAAPSSAPAHREQPALHIVVLHADGVTFGLVVDEILSSQEIVVKPLAEGIKRAPVFSGATILGDGRVALILDAPGLARHAGVAAASARPGPQASAEAKDAVPAAERRTWVLFRVRDDWRVAVPLEGVSRLEEIPRASVERVGDRAVAQYRGGILPLTRLIDLLEPASPGAGGDPSGFARGPWDAARAPEGGGPLQVVVHEGQSGPVGLVVDEILEIVEESLALEAAHGRAGVRGTAVIRGRVTDLIDVPALLASAEGAGAR